jgi:hypothetical protein
MTLQQVKVHMDNASEPTALSNSIVSGRLVEKEGSGDNWVRRLPSDDVHVQVEDREGKQALEGRRRWLEGMALFARIVKDMYLCQNLKRQLERGN